MYMDDLVKPPEISVGDLEFARLGLIKLAERAVRTQGPIVTLRLPSGRPMTLLCRASHARFWKENPALFCKDTRDSGSGVAMTKSVIGKTLLTCPDGAGWKSARKEVTALLGTAKPWFQRPLASATQALINGIVENPERPLLEHCVQWATKAICQPIFGDASLNAEAESLVQELNDCFMSLLSDPDSHPYSPNLVRGRKRYDQLMAKVLQKYHPDTIAGSVVSQALRTGNNPLDRLRDVVGGMLIGSLHINALSLFWLLVHLSDNPEIQGCVGAEAQRFGLAPRRVTDTPTAFACVRESQRLKPIMAFIERQTSQPVCIEGVNLPKGRTVLFSPWMVQRDKQVWESPLTFDPQRFLNQSRITPEQYFPFGIGARSCPGTNLVNQQLTYAASTVCNALELSCDPRTRRGDIMPMFRVNLEARGPVYLNASRRLSNSK